MTGDELVDEDVRRTGDDGPGGSEGGRDGAVVDDGLEADRISPEMELAAELLRGRLARLAIAGAAVGAGAWYSYRAAGRVGLGIYLAGFLLALGTDRFIGAYS